MIIKPIILLLLICSQYALVQPTCETFIDGLEAKYPDFSSNTTLTEQETFYVQYSGLQGPRDTGERALCEKQPSMDYYLLVQFDYDYVDTRVQIETGICVIKECTKEILRSNETLMRSLFKVNNFTIAESDKISLYDINEPIPKSAMFYFSTILHVAVVAFSICSTLIIYKRQRQRRQTADTTPKALQPRNHWLMEAFDLRVNLKALYQTAKEQKQNENLALFNFLRVLSAWWVLASHAFGLTGAVVITAGPSISYFGFLLTNGGIAVECFFFVSGLLSVYVLVPKFQKEELTWKSLFHHLKHRFTRIWPLCMASVFFYLFVVRYMFTGPFWGRYGIADYCSEYWLSKMFLVDNLVMVGGGGCALWTWYASVDLQSYIVVLLVVSIYAQSKTGGYVSAALFMFASLVIAEDRGGPFFTYYIYPPARVNEILFGMIWGMQYYEYAKLKSQKNLYWLCERYDSVKYIAILVGIVIWWFVAYYVPATVWITPHWLTLGKIYMMLAAALISAPMITQKPFWPKAFFNLRLWQILGKLSFGVYLFHFPIIHAILWSRDRATESHTTSFMTDVTPKAILGATIVSAFYWIFLEKPLLAIEAHSNKKQHPTPAAKQNEAASILELSAKQTSSDRDTERIGSSPEQQEHRVSNLLTSSKNQQSYKPLQEV